MAKLYPILIVFELDIIIVWRQLIFWTFQAFLVMMILRGLKVYMQDYFQFWVEIHFDKRNFLKRNNLQSNKLDISQPSMAGGEILVYSNVRQRM